MSEWKATQEAVGSQAGGDESVADAAENGDVDDGSESMSHDSSDLDDYLPTVLEIFNNTPKVAAYVRRHLLNTSRNTGGPELTVPSSDGSQTPPVQREAKQSPKYRKQCCHPPEKESGSHAARDPPTFRVPTFRVPTFQTSTVGSGLKPESRPSAQPSSLQERRRSRSTTKRRPLRELTLYEDEVERGVKACPGGDKLRISQRRKSLAMRYLK